MSLPRGAVVWLDPGPTVGHEQAGGRPCVVLSPPEVTRELRFRLVAVVPLTSRTDLAPRYPVIAPGPSGVRVPSAALVDNVRAVDSRRLRRFFGVIRPEEQAALDAALAWFLGLSPP